MIPIPPRRILSSSGIASSPGWSILVKVLSLRRFLVKISSSPSSLSAAASCALFSSANSSSQEQVTGLKQRLHSWAPTGSSYLLYFLRASTKSLRHPLSSVYREGLRMPNIPVLPLDLEVHFRLVGLGINRECFVHPSNLRASDLKVFLRDCSGLFLPSRHFSPVPERREVHKSVRILERSAMSLRGNSTDWESYYAPTPHGAHQLAANHCRLSVPGCLTSTRHSDFESASLNPFGVIGEARHER